MKLEILTEDEQFADICEEYWLIDDAGKFARNVQEIASRYGMKPHLVSKLVEQYSYVWLPEIFCTHCKQHYWFRTRGQYQERDRYKGRICSDCLETGHQTIADIKRIWLAERRELTNAIKVDPSTLGLKSKIYLIAIILALGDEHFSKIEPLGDYPACTLSPDAAHDLKVLRYLIGQNLLAMSLDSSLDAIELDGEGLIIDLRKLIFEITLTKEQVKKLISNFGGELTTSSIKQSKDFIDLCRQIQLSECLGFLTDKLAEHQLSLVPGEKTKQVLSTCLERFSVAQIYNFIWRAVTNAAAYYMRSNIPRRQAANSVVGAISRYMEQALANEWDVKAFKRNYNLPQSMLSHVVFNIILNTDDGGFSETLEKLLQ